MSTEPGVHIDVDDQTSAAPVRQRATRRNPRETAPREPLREAARGAVVKSRSGEELSRKRKTGVDPFHIPPEIVPKGWSYQWNVVSVSGNADIVLDQGLGMYENGWRPVPAERHPGLYVPHGTTGAVIRGGQRLEERPIELTREARQDEVRDARALISDRNDSLKLSGVKNGLSNGFEMGRQRGTGGKIKMSIDPGVFADDDGEIREAPRPSHQLAEPGED